MKLYISGPMTGRPDYNRPAFNAAATQLRAAGYEIVNPADLGVDDTKTWADYLRADLHLLLGCVGLACLPEWHLSRGARLEHHVAAALGMPIASYAAWLRTPDRDAFARELANGMER